METVLAQFEGIISISPKPLVSKLGGKKISLTFTHLEGLLLIAKCQCKKKPPATHHNT